MRISYEFITLATLNNNGGHNKGIENNTSTYILNP